MERLSVKMTYTKFMVLLFPIFLGAQTANKLSESYNAIHFPQLIYTEIKGAPRLSDPILVMGETKPVMGEGMGWASPAFFDVDGDGNKDLLIGEFGSRFEDNGIPIGNFVRVYLNEGNNSKPKFSDF